jgi:hypothetical protein
VNLPIDGGERAGAATPRRFCPARGFDPSNHLWITMEECHMKLKFLIAISLIVLALPAGAQQQYVIERDIPGAGELTAEELRGISRTSRDVLEKLGPDIKWIQSYVVNDKIYCVYEAANEDLIRRHAEMGGFPTNRISPVNAVIDPSTAE